MNPKQIAEFHDMICAQEKNADRVKLLIQFHRGALLIEAKQRQINLSVPRSTARKYESFAVLIWKFPRLLVSGLCFSQIIKHKTRLTQALCQPQNNELCCQLGQSIEFVFQGTKISVEVKDSEIVIPSERLSTDADSEFLDQIESESNKNDDEFDEFVNNYNRMETKMETNV